MCQDHISTKTKVSGHEENLQSGIKAFLAVWFFCWNWNVTVSWDQTTASEMRAAQATRFDEKKMLNKGRSTANRVIDILEDEENPRLAKQW